MASSTASSFGLTKGDEYPPPRLQRADDNRNSLEEACNDSRSVRHNLQLPSVGMPEAGGSSAPEAALPRGRTGRTYRKPRSCPFSLRPRNDGSRTEDDKHVEPYGALQ